jgi:hypothetical protein
MSDRSVTWETMWPVAIVDLEMGSRVVTRCKDEEEAQWTINYLYEKGGEALKKKIDRGGFGIDVPD